MKISTIIPVYNSEKYLNKCIDSIIAQTIGFNNIELIIVDDDSTDDSKKIIELYQEKYTNIKYIYQKNSGQAKARNVGLSVATGDYVSFVDSDDWIDATMYEELTSYNENYDIITCDYSFVKNGEYKYVSFRNCFDEQKNFIIMNTGPCNMIIKKDFLKSINFKFPEGIVYEDLASIPLLGIHTNKIKYVEKSYYNYFVRSDSTMNQKKYSKKLEDIFKSTDILYNQWKSIDKDGTFYNELEFLFIRRLLMSASLRFIEFNDPNKCIIKISNIMKEKFPKWRKNVYYKKMKFKQRIVAILAYRKSTKTLKVLFSLNNK